MRFLVGALACGLMGTAAGGMTPPADEEHAAVEGLWTGTPGDRVAAIESLTPADLATDEVCESLIELALNETDDTVRRRAIWMLGGCRDRGTETLEILLRERRDLRWVLLALARNGYDAGVITTTVLGEPDLADRFELLATLRRMRALDWRGDWTTNDGLAIGCRLSPKHRARVPRVDASLLVVNVGEEARVAWLHEYQTVGGGLLLEVARRGDDPEIWPPFSTLPSWNQLTLTRYTRLAPGGSWPAERLLRIEERGEHASLEVRRSQTERPRRPGDERRVLPLDNALGQAVFVEDGELWVRFHIRGSDLVNREFGTPATVEALERAYDARIWVGSLRTQPACVAVEGMGIKPRHGRSETPVPSDWR